jgi:polypeptide N-acetylgalactosaminyltransferase
MAGGLFAISSRWFWELGGYDPGLDIWGGEQYELSFKLWQCGGMMVDAPCSRVGHIYRKFAPFPNPGVGDFVGRNYRRVAEVWMDEYKEHLYRRRPHYRNIDPGDISAQLAIREKLHCKPFSWFMKEVAFDLPKKYPPVEPPLTAEGELRNVASNLCIDIKFRNSNERFGLEPCTKDNPGLGGEQQLELTWHRDVRPRRRSMCFDVSQSIAKAPIILYNCHGMQGNQWWKYNMDTKQMFHPISGQCLDCDPAQKEVFMQHCDESVLTQRWEWGHINATLARIEWKAAKDDM